MNQEELESLVTRLLDTKSITTQEAVELLKLNIPTKEYINTPVYYPYCDWLYRPWQQPYYTTSTTSNNTQNV